MSMTVLMPNPPGRSSTSEDASSTPSMPSMSPAANAPPRLSKPPARGSLRHANSVELMHKRWRSGSGGVAADGSSGGSRAGHAFTVRNVGSNGTIFLRPMTRSRASPPQFTFPGPDPPHASHPPHSSDLDDSRSGTNTPTPTRPRSASASSNTPLQQPHPSPPRHRTYSHSTLDERPRIQRTDSGNLFRVVIDRPDHHHHKHQSTDRPRTAEAIPILGVSIPHYRLGTPRFSARGTAFLHTSICTSTNDELRSSLISHRALFPLPPGMEGGRGVAYRWNSRPSAVSLTSTPTPGAPPRGPPGDATDFDPSIYDELTFSPSAHSPGVIRYSPTSGAIVAATPARLIAQITSPDFLDYDLLSDFFLTYRLFMSGFDLLSYLMARLQWACERPDEIGKIVRVRAFVALRHWILNYFVDDFVPDFALRAAFCDLLNTLCTFLRRKLERGANAFKILGQLKKCWRRTFALYWDGMDPEDECDAEEDILPGGPPGSREGTDPRRLAIDAVPPQGEGPHGPHDPTHTLVRHEPPRELPALSPTSDTSAPVFSCSFPGFKHGAPTRIQTAAYPLHPVPHDWGGVSVANPPTHHPHHSVHVHKKSSSTDTIKPVPTNSMLGLSIGSFIRGNVFPPPAPYVSDLAPLTPLDKIRGTEYFPHDEVEGVKEHRHGPGMKKLLGSVRRAWSTKTTGVGVDSSHGSVSSGPSTTGGAMVAGAEPGAGRPLRVDIMAAKISERFKVAVRQLEEARSPPGMGQGMISGQGHGQGVGPGHDTHADSETHGSRSIVIIDDTGPPANAMPSRPVASRSTTGDRETVPLVLDPTTTTKPKEEPVPPIPRQYQHKSPPQQNQHSSPAEDHKSPPVQRHHDQYPPIPRDQQSPPVQRHHDQQSPPPKRPRTSVHSSLRRLASLQSGMSRARNPSFDATTTDTESKAHPPGPERMLRRRPGGDLRAAKNVNDLEILPRPRSAGSLTTRTGSIASSFHIEHAPPGKDTRRRYSLGALANKDTSLIQTHSSQPNLRPSFEAEVAKLAQLPDDEEEDGGVESTLLKLEGRFEKSPSAEASPSTSFIAVSPDVGAQPVSSTDTSNDSSLPGFVESVEERPGSMTPPPPPPHEESNADGPIFSPLSPRTQQRGHSHITSYASGTSYSSIPLLERGLGDDHRSRAWEPHQTSVGSEHDESVESDFGSPDPSIEYVEETESLRQIARGETEHESFLLDDDEDMSDISTDLSDSVASTSRPALSRESSGTFPRGMLSSHQRQSQVPPSPPLTTDKISPSSDKATPQQHEEIPNAPPTPARTPTTRDPLQRTISIPKLPETLAHSATTGPSAGQAAGISHNSVHLCFILEYESELLAEQFTLVEKHALDEVDWKELVDLRSKDASTQAVNWVDFLQSGASGGVDLVVARFNIMVKWALSEIVLTQNIEERARTISKYIHIAAHSRRLRNFATTYELTVALMSADSSRLTKTWALVPARDMDIFHDLELLVQPMRNFQRLRSEMEAPVPDAACVPFIGVYTHDLIFNSQRPDTYGLKSSADPNVDALVNFERHRVTASVVKSLLRLLDASSRYHIQPNQDVLSKCLWMARLGDDEIHARSVQLEP